MGWPEQKAGPDGFKKNAEVAQLVEHNLPKVRVAGSSPVFRSKPKKGIKAKEARSKIIGRALLFPGLYYFPGFTTGSKATPSKAINAPGELQ